MHFRYDPQCEIGSSASMNDTAHNSSMSHIDYLTAMFLLVDRSYSRLLQAEPQHSLKSASWNTLSIQVNETSLSTSSYIRADVMREAISVE